MPRPGPLSFQPIFKDYPWGGRNLALRLGRELPPGVIAESWEISAHPNGPTRVKVGPWAGWTLDRLVGELGSALLGSRNAKAIESGRFPLLVKLLDAHEWLSVQVHPDDGYATDRHGEPGKTELWQVLHAEPGAELILGFSHAIDRATFAEAVRTGTVEEHLARVAVRAGDAFFVRPGTIHALGPGVIVAEIQQNSDLTFRIYDWGRTDAAGRPRPLHLDQALEVLDFSAVTPGKVIPEPAPEGAPGERLAACPHFVVERLRLGRGATYEGACDGETFEIWGVTRGAVELATHQPEAETLRAIDWTLLPAELGRFSVRSVGGDASLLRITSPPLVD